ncbi:VOC family protein [Streptomonospora sp. PA3]|uniref:VOC family protein n=1 Tax=Streptomonospora sp. PA3 TaxID=2607326 RepID=UPI0012DD33B8|nr:VOC family protein [Streptomonospora sp. PA3]MUL43400.1 VOC family protein [Streptomonospora sp. PA3]
MVRTRVEIRAVVVDCRSPERLAEFWSQVLDRPVGARIGPYVLLEHGAGPQVVFQRVEAVGSGKNRVHLDLSCPDPAAEQRRIEALGGRRLPEYADGGFLVMADPEGNEFCLLPEGPFDIDDQGRADYLPG